MPEVVDWLKTLGMSEYAERFAESDIDTSVLCELTDQDLKELGVSLGHRRKMLRAIAELVAVPPTQLLQPACLTGRRVGSPDHLFQMSPHCGVGEKTLFTCAGRNAGH